MTVSMASLARATVSAALFGFLFWCLFVVLAFPGFLLPGTGRGHPARRVFREIGIALFCLLFALGLTVFLYAVNHGVLRWFLVGAAVGIFALCEGLFGKTVRGFEEKNAALLRRIILFTVGVLTYPVRIVLRLVGKLVRRVWARFSGFCCSVRKERRIRAYDKRRRKAPFSDGERKLRDALKLR